MVLYWKTVLNSLWIAWPDQYTDPAPAADRLLTDQRVGAPARHDAPAHRERRRLRQVVRLAHADALLLRPEERRRSPTAVDPDGERKVQLWLRVPGRARQAGADAAHRPLLPDHDAGVGRQPRGLTVRLVNFSPSHLEGSFTSVGHPGYCHSPVLVANNVDVRQPILLHISSDGVRIS